MDRVVDALIVVLVLGTLATAWSWPGAYARVISFGHAVFFGLGGYAVAVSNLRGGSPWYGALGGALASAGIAVVLGLACLRGPGLTFAGVTLAAGIAAEPFVAGHAWLGPHDVYAFPQRTGFLHLQFAARWPYLVLALVVFGVTTGFTFGLRASRAGLYLRALRSNLAAARSIGIEALPTRLLVLAPSAFVTSVAGSFYAQYRLAVEPQTMFALALSLDVALLGALAGPRRPWGAVLAALAYVLLARIVPLHPAGPAGTTVLVAEAAAIVLIALRCPDGVMAASGRRRARELANAA